MFPKEVVRGARSGGETTITFAARALRVRAVGSRF
jgi:hypothetical protein